MQGHPLLPNTNSPSPWTDSHVSCLGGMAATGISRTTISNVGTFGAAHIVCHAVSLIHGVRSFAKTILLWTL